MTTIRGKTAAAKLLCGLAVLAGHPVTFVERRGMEIFINGEPAKPSDFLGGPQPPAIAMAIATRPEDWTPAARAILEARGAWGARPRR